MDCIASNVYDVDMANERLSASLTMRITADMEKRLALQAQLLGIPANQVARNFLEEALRMAEFPGIVFRSEPTGRRPALDGRMDIWEVIMVWKGWEGDVDGVCETCTLRPDQVNLAVAYYRRYPEEIDAWIRSNDELEERMMGEAANG